MYLNYFISCLTWEVQTLISIATLMIPMTFDYSVLSDMNIL